MLLSVPTDLHSLTPRLVCTWPPQSHPPGPRATLRNHPTHWPTAALHLQLCESPCLRMLTRTLGPPTAHGCRQEISVPFLPMRRRKISAPFLRHQMPRPDGMLHPTHTPVPDCSATTPLDTGNPPFANHSNAVVPANHSSAAVSLSTSAVMMILVTPITTAMRILVTTTTTPLALAPMATTPTPLEMFRSGGPHVLPTPLGMFRFGERLLCPLVTATDPCMPARWVLVIST